MSLAIRVDGWCLDPACTLMIQNRRETFRE